MHPGAVRCLNYLIPDFLPAPLIWVGVLTWSLLFLLDPIKYELRNILVLNDKSLCFSPVPQRSKRKEGRELRRERQWGRKIKIERGLLGWQVIAAVVYLGAASECPGHGLIVTFVPCPFFMDVLCFLRNLHWPDHSLLLSPPLLLVIPSYIDTLPLSLNSPLNTSFLSWARVVL